ncbi:MAG: hypothetical protein A3E78_06040 [Alphaproteobacteria bacterium RIFCSPHIGHO2_12_FULL_63_12]|nr:MAG: hypothetical protein A3E78_06040 [Alphaproteobacteria bacterium RIFCSPHIGHO2_12_FULL_63_12]
MNADNIIAKHNDRFAGWLMAAASVLSVVVMAHHPTGGGDMRLVNGVHGALMGLILINIVGFFRFGSGEGLARLSVSAGLVAYAAGMFGNLLAATINGFAAPALMARGASKDVLGFAWELNQALAYEAVYAISAAYVLWGIGLVRRGARAVGVAGIAAGAAPAALLAAGALDMHVAGAMIIYAAQSAFAFIIGIRMAMTKP